MFDYPTTDQLHPANTYRLPSTMLRHIHLFGLQGGIWLPYPKNANMHNLSYKLCTMVVDPNGISALEKCLFVEL